MGNSQSQDKHNSQIIGLNNLLTHPKFSNAKIIDGAFGMPHILLTVSVPNKKLYINWKQRINNLTIKSKDNLPLMLPLQMEYNQDSYCGSSGIMKVKYEKFPFILSQQIENRAEAGRRFKQNEIWYITYVFVLAAGQLHRSNRILGDIRPFNTFINDNGEILLGNICTFYDEQLNYQKTRLFKETTYLAPQVLQQISNGYDPKSNELIAQDFAIGLTLLDVAILQSSEELYGKAYEFDKPKLKKKLETLETCIQNEKLKSIIKGLCSTNPKYRMKCEDILETLSPYEQQILNLQTFIIEDSQDKLVPVGLSKRSSIIRQSTLKQSSRVEQKRQPSYDKVVKKDKSPSPVKYTRQQQQQSFILEQNNPPVFSPPQPRTVIVRNLPPLPPNLNQQSINQRFIQPISQPQYYVPRTISQKIIGPPNYRESRSLSRQVKPSVSYQNGGFLGQSPSPRVFVHPPQISRTNSFSRIDNRGQNTLNYSQVETMYVPGQINTAIRQAPIVTNQNNNFNRTTQNCGQCRDGGYQQFLRRSKIALKQNSTIESNRFTTQNSFKEASSIYVPEDNMRMVNHPNKYDTPSFKFEKPPNIQITTSRVQYPDYHNPEPSQIYSNPQYKYETPIGRYQNQGIGYDQYNDNLRRIENQIRQTRMKFPER